MDTHELLEEIEQRGGACSESLDRLKALYDLWQPLRKETIALLKSVLSQADDSYNNGTVLKPIGIAAVLGGIVATPIVAASFLYSIKVGYALIVAGGAVVAGTGIACVAEKIENDIDRKPFDEEQRRALLQDRLTTQRLRACIDEVNTNAIEIMKIHMKIRELQRTGKETQETIDRSGDSEGGMVKGEFEALKEGSSAIADLIKQAITKQEVTISPKFAGKLKTALKAILKLPKTYMALRQMSLHHAQALSSVHVVSGSCLPSEAMGGTLVKRTKGGTTASVGKGLVYGTAPGYAISIDIDALEKVVANVRKGSKTQDLQDICRQLQQEKADFDQIYSELQEN